MALKRRQFTREFKLQVLHEIDAGKGISQAAREYQVHPNMIHRWRAHYCDYGERAFAGNGIGYFLEEVYNQKRLHSAIGYRPPAEYEQLLNQTTLT